MTQPAEQTDFRYFRDADGSRWKMPTDNSRGYYWSNARGGWIDQPTNLSGLLLDVEEDGTIETDSNGAPLAADGSAPFEFEPGWAYFRNGNRWKRTNNGFQSEEWYAPESKWSFAGIYSERDLEKQGWLRGEPAPAAPGGEQSESVKARYHKKIVDEFRGDNAHLCECIRALIRMSDDGVLTSNAIGGHARSLLAAAYHRLTPATMEPEPSPPAGGGGECELPLAGGYSCFLESGHDGPCAARVPKTPTPPPAATPGDLPRDHESVCHPTDWSAIGNSKDKLASRIRFLEAQVDYAKRCGLHIAIGKSTDCPEGRLQHDYIEGSELDRMFTEWSGSIGWQEEKAELELESAEHAEAAQKYASKLQTLSDIVCGGHTVARFSSVKERLEDKLRELETLKSESAGLREVVAALFKSAPSTAPEPPEDADSNDYATYGGKCEQFYWAQQFKSALAGGEEGGE